MTLTPEQLMAAKGQGFLPLKDKIHFACRILIPAGHMTKEHSDKIGELAEKYGRGYFTLTQRLDVEIPWVTYENMDALRAELLEVGLEVGGTGPRVRPILTCKGTVCRLGLYDTEAVALEMHERFYKKYYPTKLPNKIRIGISGCFNSCSKPQTMCIGLQGKKTGQVAVIIGGMFGREKALGRELAGLYTVEDALDIIERGIIFFKDNANAGERFATMVERLGFETVEKAMLGN